MCVISHIVTMQLWVECIDTQRTLLHPQRYIAHVQPPVWTQDDPVALEMHLDHLAKLKFLADMRKTIRDFPATKEMLSNNRFIIRGMMESWQSPPKPDGSVILVTFPQDKLRCA